ncbi:hypothetical protein Dsin_004494 [Dipteronia sinensis]|uniref:Uncharacterized protein n=1 Tax=Dipteronia sinensis TaxID=43782 RepID=A0AAE0EE97_9ROSI|nr:hypothetical protein Dsin_004494 [Dipteronia sinensis]
MSLIIVVEEDQIMEDDRRSKSKQKAVEVEEEEEEENNEALKRRISTHPLYNLLLDNHMDCLKVGSIIKAEIEQGKTGMRRDHTMPSTSIGTLSELDHFMEAYCKALSKLKEAMEEPQQETVAFINDMHSQLRDLTTSNPPPNTSSGKIN